MPLTMNLTRRRVATAVACIASTGAIGAGLPGTALADGNPQPATSSCVIQGEGTPCTMSSGGSSETAAESSAVSWAQQQEGSDIDDGYCLQFVADAYSQAGVDITTQAGEHDSAVDYWNTYTGTKNPPSDTPPAGALVFWGATSSNPYGHVAISEGNGNAVSTTERDNVGVHEFSIADRDSDGYVQLGWVMPG